MILKSNEIKLLHGLRGVAALIVVVCHAKWPFWSGGTMYLEHYPRESWGWWNYVVFGVNMASSNGKAWVVVFFVLSGFFIAYSYSRTKWKYFNFLQIRLIRIYVPVFASILMGFLIFKFFEVNDFAVFNVKTQTEFQEKLQAAAIDLTIIAFVKSLFFLRSDEVFFAFLEPFWSLLPEVIFYLVSYWMIRKSTISFIVAIILVLVGRYFLPWEHNIFHKTIFLYSLFFASGVFFFNLAKKREFVKVCSRFRIFIILAAVGSLITMTFGKHLSYEFISYIASIIFTVAVISLILAGSKLPTQVTVILVFLGKISYSLYLSHLPVLALLYVIYYEVVSQEIIFNPFLYWLTVPVTIIVGYGLYIVVEKPSINFLARLRPRK